MEAYNRTTVINYKNDWLGKGYSPIHFEQNNYHMVLSKQV